MTGSAMVPWAAKSSYMGMAMNEPTGIVFMTCIAAQAARRRHRSINSVVPLYSPFRGRPRCLRAMKPQAPRNDDVKSDGVQCWSVRSMRRTTRINAPILHHEVDLRGVADITRGIGIQNHQIGQLPGRDRAAFRGLSQRCGADFGCGLDRLQWRETAMLDQQRHFLMHRRHLVEIRTIL